MAIKRSSGVLMPIFSLPAPHGVGTLGKAACDFVDFLKAAGQTWWQILPVGPLSYGDSPYQSFSTYAGNPYFVDLDLLAADGLLTAEELRQGDWGDDPARVDYGKLYNGRYVLLRKAAARGIPRDGAALEAFCAEQKGWLEDYALFAALKQHFEMRPWMEWPEDIRLHQEAACARWRTELAEEIRFQSYVQFLFDRQWRALKKYANEQGVRIIGDLPIYVAMDSADVWSGPKWFQLDEKNVPTEVAGVPPDYFNEDGQLWGNPLYDWDAMEKDGFGWWIRRVEGAFRLYDALRFDHFRGLESYWAVPYGAATARTGRWVKGPGMKLVGVLKNWFSGREFIAEDLGYLTPEVRQLLEDSGFPGMKVLEFAFDPREPSDYLPHTYTKNCICYTGTHDNSTVLGWREEVSRETLAFARRYLGVSRNKALLPAMLRAGMGSVANLFVVQMQDYLELGREGRVNTPGVTGGNWGWRMRPGAITPELTKKIAEMTKLYGRSALA